MKYFATLTTQQDHARSVLTRECMTKTKNESLKYCSINCSFSQCHSVVNFECAFSIFRIPFLFDLNILINNWYNIYDVFDGLVFIFYLEVLHAYKGGKH